ncbi:sugar phosphate isomerase/epimerase family protein [Microbacterium aurantiacum]|uniref:sugar phosphate isomerase/epimerase family protein n=1 Tax=Microbacterium aurantiacum TaxID=162393 RepID=UPI00287BA532|nr:TIM barrel protein [Microbacterium aurantiacum]
MTDESAFRYGVSLYSYTGDMNTVLTLDDAMAEIASVGATGIEILGESNVACYPTPSTAWIDRWWASLDAHGLQPSNYCSWVDVGIARGRDLTAEEGMEVLARDIRLASTLGFTSIRPKFGVVSMELDPHPLWRPVVEANLTLAEERGVVICPEIHAPTPIRHCVVDEYIAFIEQAGSEHFRLMIDTGIFQREVTTAIQPGMSDEGHKEGWMRPLAVPMSDLVDVLPYVAFIQTKFFDIDEDLVDAQIPWAEIVDTLVAHDYRGWLSSEYEGERVAYRGQEQVRRHHALLRSLEREARADR